MGLSHDLYRLVIIRIFTCLSISVTKYEFCYLLSCTIIPVLSGLVIFEKAVIEV